MPADWTVAGLEGAEIRAMRDLHLAAPPSVGAAVAEVGGGTLLFLPAGPPPQFDRVLGLGLEGPASDAALDEVVAAASAHGRPWAVGVAPTEGSEALEARLLARGFRRGYAWMRFLRDTAPPPCATTTQLRLAEAGRDEAATFAALIAHVFGTRPVAQPALEALVGREHWSCWLAWAGDTAVAAAAAFVDGGVAWLGLAATLPEYRRWGAQGALLAARLATARERGATQAVIETGERVPGRPSASYRNILRAGFEEAYLRQHLLAPPPAPHAAALAAW